MHYSRRRSRAHFAIRRQWFGRWVDYLQYITVNYFQESHSGNALPFFSQFELYFFSFLTKKHPKDCFETNVPHKWPFYDHFWPFFCLMYVHLSQNWGSDGRFEVLNRSYIWFVQKLWQKTQIFPFLFFFAILYKNRSFRLLHFLHFCVFCRNFCTN